MIERCFDYRKIKRILKIYPVISSEIYYLVDGENLWTLHEKDGQLLIHANMNTKHGKDAIESAREAFRWIFDNTEHNKIVAKIQKENRAACFIAQQCMKFTHKDTECHYYEVINELC